MAFNKFGAALLVLALVASCNAQVYFNKPVKPEVASALSTTNEILCEYLNINCAPGTSGFNLPPAPPPPGSAASGPSAPAPGAPTPTADLLAQIFGRRLLRRSL